MAQIQFSLIRKIKIGRPEHSLTPQLPTSHNISFFVLTLYPLPTPQNGRHMCITPNKYHKVVILCKKLWRASGPGAVNFLYTH